MPSSTLYPVSKTFEKILFFLQNQLIRHAFVRKLSKITWGKCTGPVSLIPYPRQVLPSKEHWVVEMAWHFLGQGSFQGQDCISWSRILCLKQKQMKVTTSIESMMLRLGYPIENFEYNSLIVENLFELGSSFNKWYNTQ